MTEQLQLDLDAACRRLADQLRDRRRIPPTGGAERLLSDLIRNGLDERALLPAAALVIALELDSRREASP